MSLCGARPRAYGGLCSEVSLVYRAAALRPFSGAGMKRSSTADKTSAGSSRGADRSAAGLERASVTADTVSAWHRAGWQALADTGRGQVWLAELPVFSRADARQQASNVFMLSACFLSFILHPNLFVGRLTLQKRQKEI